jgi:hypothetical protein
MQPLPEFPYEFAKWKTATVQMNYHIAVDYQNYSVPYAYVGKKVDVRATEYFTPQRTPVRFLKPPVHGNKTIVI